MAAECLGTVGGDTHPRCRRGLAIVHEHVALAIRVAGDQIEIVGVERDVAAVAAYRRHEGGRRREVELAGRTAARDDSTRRRGLAIAHEYVDLSVGVPGHQVGGLGLEDDEPAVGRHGHRPAGAVPDGPRGRPADELDDAGLVVAKEGVDLSVRVTGEQSGIGRRERDVATAGREDRAVAPFAEVLHTARRRRRRGHGNRPHHGGETAAQQHDAEEQRAEVRPLDTDHGPHRRSAPPERRSATLPRPRLLLHASWHLATM